MKNIKIVVYSSNGTSNIDLRIISQYNFLKLHFSDVKLIEEKPDLFNNKKESFFKKIYKLFFSLKGLILYFHKKICKKFIYFHKKICEKFIYLKTRKIAILLLICKALLIMPTYVIYKIIKKLFLKMVNIVDKINNKFYVDNTIKRQLKIFDPNIIITRDMHTDNLLCYKKENPKTIFINDLHEIWYWQQKEINLKLKEKQEMWLKTCNGIITVNDYVYNDYYTFIKNHVSIPNCHYNELFQNIKKPNFHTNPNKVKFIINGGFWKERDGIIYEIIKLWNEVDGKAILYLRLLDTHDKKKLYNKILQMQDSPIKSGRIVFLDPIIGNLEAEMDSIINQYDVGFITIDKTLSPLYNIASPNRLSTYLHSGLALLGADSKFCNDIITESQAGEIFKMQTQEDKDNFVMQINNLINNPDKIMQMKKNAYNFAKTKFNYKNYGKNLVTMIEKLISNYDS